MDDYFYPPIEPAYTAAHLFEFDGISDTFSITPYEHIFNQQYAKYTCGTRAVSYTFTLPTASQQIPASAGLTVAPAGDGLINTASLLTYAKMGNMDERSNTYSVKLAVAKDSAHSASVYNNAFERTVPWKLTFRYKCYVGATARAYFTQIPFTTDQMIWSKYYDPTATATETLDFTASLGKTYLQNHAFCFVNSFNLLDSTCAETAVSDPTDKLFAQLTGKDTLN